jgi:16S rRNA (guanine527-N7)-methyltransferase
VIYRQRLSEVRGSLRMSLHQRFECVFIAAANESGILITCTHKSQSEGTSLSMTSIVVPSESTIRKAMNEFQIAVNTNQITQIQEYIRLLLVWNEKVNLTAIRDPLEILYRHFCESMFATKVVELEKCRLADIGTGAGFPGLALKILLPEAQVVLVESNIKKATFLAEVVRALGITGTSVLVSRYEGLGDEIAPADFLLVRALGEFEVFLKWAASERVNAKRAILWIGADNVEQVSNSPRWVWEPPVVVPHSLRRVLLVGAKVAP